MLRERFQNSALSSPTRCSTPHKGLVWDSESSAAGDHTGRVMGTGAMVDRRWRGHQHGISDAGVLRNTSIQALTIGSLSFVVLFIAQRCAPTSLPGAIQAGVEKTAPSDNRPVGASKPHNVCDRQRRVPRANESRGRSDYGRRYRVSAHQRPMNKSRLITNTARANRFEPPPAGRTRSTTSPAPKNGRDSTLANAE